jgi:hypothetical protein
MWNCNGSASPAVCPERRVLLIVTLLAAGDDGPLALGWVGYTSRAEMPNAGVAVGVGTGPIRARGARPGNASQGRPCQIGAREVGVIHQGCRQVRARQVRPREGPNAA